MNDFNETAELNNVNDRTEINHVNETVGTELHNGIQESAFQQLINAGFDQNIVNQFANSGLTFAQAAAAITPAQEQEILSTFGSDSNFQAFLHGQATPPVTVVGVPAQDLSHAVYGAHHFG